jgi:hypothetical protein
MTELSRPSGPTITNEIDLTEKLTIAAARKL